MGGALAVLVLTTCSPTSTTTSNRPASGATPSVGSSTSEAGAAPSLELPCSESIASLLQPSSGNTVVLGVVALPTSDARAFALQTDLSGERDPTARLFAKSGLEINAGAAFEIVVPDEAANRFSIGWGSPAKRTRHLVVRGCHAESSWAARVGSAICDSGFTWFAYAGGYWLQQVGCLPLLVRAGGQQRRILIGVGAPCAGQSHFPGPRGLHTGFDS